MMVPGTDSDKVKQFELTFPVGSSKNEIKKIIREACDKLGISSDKYLEFEDSERKKFGKPNGSFSSKEFPIFIKDYAEFIQEFLDGSIK